MDVSRTHITVAFAYFFGSVASQSFDAFTTLELNNHTYLMSKDTATYVNAKTNCSNSGLELAFFVNNNEYFEVVKYVHAYLKNDNIQVYDMWIDLNVTYYDYSISVNWRNETIYPEIWSNIYPKEPNENCRNMTQVKCCARIHWDNYTPGDLRDAQCSTVPYRYMCAPFYECSDGTHKCEHICIEKIDGYACICNSGYVLAGDGRRCEDIDECTTEASNCQHDCKNTNGSFVCNCRSGFALSNDTHSCDDINEYRNNTHNCSQICQNGNYNCSQTCGNGNNNCSQTCGNGNNNCSRACPNGNNNCSQTCGNGNNNCSQTCQNVSYNCSHICQDGNNTCSETRETGNNNCSQTNGDGYYNCSQTCQTGNYNGSQTCQNGNNNCSQTCQTGNYNCSQICENGNNNCSHKCQNENCSQTGENGDYNCSHIFQDWNYKCEQICQEWTYNCSQSCLDGNCNCSHISSDTNYNFSQLCLYEYCNCSHICQDGNWSQTSHDGNYNCSQTCQDGNYNCSQTSQDGNYNCSQTSQDGNYNCSQTSQDGNYNCSLTCQDGNYSCSRDQSEADQVCITTNDSCNCECPEGFYSGPGNSPCHDVNECDLNPPACEHHCNNTIGSFICTCREEFTLQADGKSCKNEFQTKGQFLCPRTNHRNHNTLDSMADIIKVHLLLNLKNLSSYRNTKISAPDFRPTSQAIGYSGLTIVILLLGCIILNDSAQLMWSLAICYRFAKRYNKRVKKIWHQKV